MEKSILLENLKTGNLNNGVYIISGTTGSGKTTFLQEIKETIKNVDFISNFDLLAFNSENENHISLFKDKLKDIKEKIKEKKGLILIDELNIVYNNLLLEEITPILNEIANDSIIIITTQNENESFGLNDNIIIDTINLEDTMEINEENINSDISNEILESDTFGDTELNTNDDTILETEIEDDLNLDNDSKDHVDSENLKLEETLEVDNINNDDLDLNDLDENITIEDLTNNKEDTDGLSDLVELSENSSLEELTDNKEDDTELEELIEDHSLSDLLDKHKIKK